MKLNKIAGKNLKKIFNAFSLAEVLITIAIIGVVAALTIPSIISNYRAQELKSQFKKVYNTLSQVGMKMRADGIAKNFNKAKSAGEVALLIQEEEKNIDSYYKYFKIIKKVDDNKKSIAKCFESGGYAMGLLKSSSKYSYGGYILSDGSYVRLVPNGSCAMRSLNFSTTGIECFLDAIVDINGPNKMPNRFGYDVFGFEILPTGIVIAKRDDPTIKDSCALLEYGSEEELEENDPCSCLTNYALNDKSPLNLNKSYFKDFLKK